MSWFNRLSNLVRRRDLNAEIDEELQFHIETRIRDNIAAGMTPDEARRDALRRFGAPPRIRDATQRRRHRCRARGTRPGRRLRAAVPRAPACRDRLGARHARARHRRQHRPCSPSSGACCCARCRSPSPERLHVISHSRARRAGSGCIPGCRTPTSWRSATSDRSFEAIATFGPEPRDADRRRRRGARRIHHRHPGFFARAPASVRRPGARSRPRTFRMEASASCW